MCVEEDKNSGIEGGLYTRATADLNSCSVSLTSSMDKTMRHIGVSFRTDRAVPLMATWALVVRVLEDELLELGRQPRTIGKKIRHFGQEHRAMSW